MSFPGYLASRSIIAGTLGDASANCLSFRGVVFENYLSVEMTSRDDILQAVRSTKLAARELPSLAGPWIAYDDRWGQFEAALRSVGGRFERLTSTVDATTRLADHPAFPRASKIASLLPDLVAGNVDLQRIDDPHRLEDVDFAIMPGQFAVAENAAVWVTHHGVKHRALWFIVQHLVLVVQATQIIDNMHQAYERIHDLDSGFGVFISGPSKTADIEQSLVMGAHGPRSLTVLVYP